MCFLVNKVSECVLLVHVMMCLIRALHVQVYRVLLLLCTYNVFIHVHYIQVHILLCDYNCGHVSV